MIKEVCFTRIDQYCCINKNKIFVKLGHPCQIGCRSCFVSWAISTTYLTDIYGNCQLWHYRYIFHFEPLWFLLRQYWTVLEKIKLGLTYLLHESRASSNCKSKYGRTGIGERAKWTKMPHSSITILLTIIISVLVLKFNNWRKIIYRVNWK